MISVDYKCKSIIKKESIEKYNFYINNLSKYYKIISITYNIKFDRQSLRKHILELFDTVDTANDIQLIKYFRLNLKTIFNFYIQENIKSMRIDSVAKYEIDNYVLNSYQELYEKACITINHNSKELYEYQKYMYLFNLTLSLLCGKNCNYINTNIDYESEFKLILKNNIYESNLEKYIDKLSTYVFILTTTIIMMLIS